MGSLSPNSSVIIYPDPPAKPASRDLPRMAGRQKLISETCKLFGRAGTPHSDENVSTIRNRVRKLNALIQTAAASGGATPSTMKFHELADGGHNGPPAFTSATHLTQRLPVALGCKNRPQSYGMVTPIRPMYSLYSCMEPSGKDLS